MLVVSPYNDHDINNNAVYFASGTYSGNSVPVNLNETNHPLKSSTLTFHKAENFTAETAWKKYLKMHLTSLLKLSKFSDKKSQTQTIFQLVTN